MEAIVRFNGVVGSRGIVDRRRQHIAELCDQHRIHRQDQPKGVAQGRADPAGRRVLIPAVTRVRSYYTALHEIGHCVLGYDAGLPAAPQEAAAWQWARDVAIERPSEGVRRMMFRAVWHYLLADMSSSAERQPSNDSMFPTPDDPFWAFMASLDTGARLLYETAKVTAHVGPPAEQRDEVQELIDAERARTRHEVSRARVEEQLRAYGPPRQARAGELVALSASGTAHIWRGNGTYGALAPGTDIVCGASGVARPAPVDARRCRSCLKIASLPG